MRTRCGPCPPCAFQPFPCRLAVAAVHSLTTSCNNTALPAQRMNDETVAHEVAILQQQLVLLGSCVAAACDTRRAARRT